MGKFWLGYASFTTSTSNKTAAKVHGLAAKRFEVCEIGMFGAGAVAPADIEHSCNVGFLTNGTTGTAGSFPTPEKMDQGGAASALTSGIAYSGEPATYATNVFQLFAFNQRGGMRWAVPQGEGYKTQGDATNLSFGTRIISSTAGSIDGNVLWWEP